jgi:hypothetical protein
MKLKCIGNVTEQIKAGVEPWEQCEIDVPLASVSEAGRAVLAEGWQPKLVEATVESAIAAIESEAAERAVKAKAERERKERLKAERIAEWHNATVQTRIASKDFFGVVVEWQESSLTYAPPNYSYETDGDLAAAYAAYLDRKNECERVTAAAREAAIAAKAAEIEAAQKAHEDKQQAAREAEEAQRLAKLARRKELGAVEVHITRGDKDWGTPWGAVVKAVRGKDNYDFDAAEYDLSTEMLTIKCQPGDVIAWGQKNFRKPKRTVHERRKVAEDFSLTTL